MSETIEQRRRRLIHRSRYTGMKETDLLLGSFAVQYVPRFGAAELDDYERLLQEQDADIFAWASGQLAPPEEHKTAVFKMISKHRIVG